MNKFKVGDRVKYMHNGSTVYNGVVVEINSGLHKNMNLCKLENFKGHKGNGCTNRGKDFDTSDYWYCCDEYTELVAKSSYHFKYNVGDTVCVNYHYKKKTHTIVKLCIEGDIFPGTYELDNGLHYEERFLTLVTKAEKSNKDKNDGEKVMMNKISKVTNIRKGSKIVVIPQEKAAPLRVACETLIATIDGVDYEAVCMPGDTFKIEDGIKAIVTKYIFGGQTEYNKYINKLVKFYDTCKKQRDEEERIIKKKEKEIARKKDRAERKANAERQARIDEMSEAFLKAMRNNSITDKERADRIAMDIETMLDIYAKKGLIIEVSDSAVEDAENND